MRRGCTQYSTTAPKIETGRRCQSTAGPGYLPTCIIYSNSHPLNHEAELGSTTQGIGATTRCTRNCFCNTVERVIMVVFSPLSRTTASTPCSNVGRAFHRTLSPPLRRSKASSLQAVASGDFNVELKPKKGGQPLTLSGDVTMVGSGPNCELSLKGPGVTEEHAKLQKKSGRLFCTALVGGGDMMADTGTWV